MNASIHRLLGVLAVIAVVLPTSAGANAPAGQYVVTAGGTGNGTVYDTKSKLTWQQTVSSTTYYTWADAKTYCAGVGASLGGTGWRLPTLKELQSLVDYSQSTAPMIDPNAFPSTPASSFWSASRLAGSPSNAWSVNFSGGGSGYGDAGCGYCDRVRCVR
jgi:Protein of unknown function (DUF1566)